MEVSQYEEAVETVINKLLESAEKNHAEDVVAYSSALQNITSAMCSVKYLKANIRVGLNSDMG